MGKSQVVRARDVLRVLRLAEELEEMPPEPGVRMQRVAECACRLLRGKLGTMGYGKGFTRRSRPVWGEAVGAGSIDPSELGVFARYLGGDHTVDPCVMAIARVEPMAFGRTRRELVSDGDWYSRPHIGEDRREAGVDDCVYSVRRRAGEPGSIQIIGLHRPWGDRRGFGESDRALLRIMHYAVRRKVEAPDPLAGLKAKAGAMPPRLRQTLGRLLAGDSEKMIARRFGLSMHTVHGYVKQIYVHFAVESRPQLLALWVRANSNADGLNG